MPIIEESLGSYLNRQQFLTTPSLDLLRYHGPSAVVQVNQTYVLGATYSTVLNVLDNALETPLPAEAFKGLTPQEAVTKAKELIES